MKILLTGANGFIGSYLLRQLSQKHQFVVVVRNRERTDASLLKLAEEVVETDLSLPFMYDTKVDALIHAAALSPTHTPSFVEYYHHNITAGNHLYRYVERQGVPRVILLSSVSVLGRISVARIDANTPIVAPDDYGLSKWCVERFFSFSSATVITLRLPGVLGIGAFTPWLSTVAQKMLNDEPVHYYNPEGLFNNALQISDLTRSIEQLLSLNVEQTPSQPLLLASREPRPLKWVVEYFAKKLGSKSHIEVSKEFRDGFYIDTTSAEALGLELLTVEQLLNCYAADLLTQKR